MSEAAGIASGITSLPLSRTAFSQAKSCVCVCASMSMAVWKGVILFTSLGRELPQPPCVPVNLILVFCKPWKYEEF